MLECNLMASFETEGRAEVHSSPDQMCPLNRVLFSAEELVKESSAASLAAFSSAETASHAEIVKALEERVDVGGGPDRYMNQVRDLYAEEEVVDDTNLTLKFLEDLGVFVKDFKNTHSLN
jgi:hypothetical protein